MIWSLLECELGFVSRFARAMGCFFGCFRIKDDHQHRPNASFVSQSKSTVRFFFWFLWCFFFFFLLLYFVNSVFFCFPCIILRSKRVYWRIASFQLFNANYIAFYLSAKFLLKQTEFILNFLMESFSVLELGSSDVRFSNANVCFRFPLSCIFLANDASY